LRISIREKGGETLNIPDEYICYLCGYVFLEGEVSQMFCPNCGSSAVAKQVEYDEFVDEDTSIIQIIDTERTIV